MMGTHNEQTSAHLGPGPAADEQEHMSTLPLPRPSQNIRPDQQFSGLGLLDTNTNPWHQMSSSSNSNGIHHQPYSHHHSNSGLEFASNLSADLQNLPPLHQPTPREPLPPLERFLHENETKAFLGAGSALHHDHASRVAASEPAWSQTGRSEFGGVPQYQDSLETTSVYSEGYPDPFYDSQPTTTASTSWAGSVDNLHKKSIDDCRLSPTSPASFRQEAAWRSSMSSSYASEPGYSPTDDRMPFRTGVLVASSSSGGPGAGPGGGSVGVGVGGGRLDVEQPLDVSEDEDADGEEEVAEDAGGRGSAPHIYVTQIASVNMQQDFHYHPSHPHHPSQSHAPTEAIARRHSSPRNTSKNVHHHRPPVHARSRSGPMPPPPRLDTTGGLQRSASSSSRSNCGRRRSIKAHSHGHQPYGTPPDHRSHSKKSQCSRPFDCVFEWAGCQQKFASKNEWKRHVSSQHLLLYYWRCDLDTCRDRHSVFNRKDLFGQHLKRMHKPTSQEDNARFLNRDIPVIQDRCKRMIRPPPDRSACGFCGEVFDGPGSWDQRMEHVGRHYENAGPDGRGVESAHWNQDHDLVAYAVRERIVFLNQDGTYTLAASGKEAVVGGALEAEQPVGVHVQQLG